MGVHIRVVDENLDSNKLRRHIEEEGCGSIVSFVGLTRGVDEGNKVKRLEFDAWEEKLPEVLTKIANDAVSRFQVKSIVIAHRIGSVDPSQEIVCIHVGSTHRKEGFIACSWLIDELKKQAPLWKKEIRDDGEYWKSGLG
ncbi:MAG: hypothetical protein CMA12_02485 [Euryarchaeota archaeon]|nr:hypothetical protein [Euryarchaeota archaeon]OUW22719.1 MAG: hypothetical protein CBD33_01055 [Euryarchaeota archaeon TMED173]|tara:strand:+ start:398 stop:817 length:420 start_codon:yes stop_codon:yes gene_type:complete